MQTIQLYPNPYCQLDGKGRLAGACPMGEELRPTSVMPSRMYVGAERKVVAHAPAASATQKSRTESVFMWEPQPVAVPFERDLKSYYVERLRSLEVFEVAGEGKVRLGHAPGEKPGHGTLLDALAAARLAAFDLHIASYGSEPDTTEWQKQFPVDAQVATRMEAMRAARDAAKSKEPKVEMAKPLAPFALTPSEAAPITESDSGTNAQGGKGASKKS